MSFFQSGLRRDLQQIFDRKILVESDYWGVRRSKMYGPLHLYRDQYLGVSWDDLLGEMMPVGATHTRGHLYTQYGCDTTFRSGSVVAAQDQAELVYSKRLEREMILSQQGLVPSWRENMPLATILTPCLPSDDLLGLMHSSHRRYYKKAVKHGLRCELATVEQEQTFYALWSQLAADKGLGIMTYDQYRAMMNYLREHQCGGLWLALQDDHIVSGSICAYRSPDTEHQQIIYLYGATDRQYGNIGGHIFLQHEIMKWGYDEGFSTFDHWGVAPLGREHHLHGVSRFKERFGGERREYVGNIDQVSHRVLYGLIKKMKRH